MLRRERLCDDDEEITRGGEERVDMEIWWCWLLRAAVPLNVHISLSLSRRTPSLFKSSSHRVSLSPFIVYPLSPPPSLPCPLSLSLSLSVCVCLSIYLDGWARTLACILCTHTHSVRIHNVLACLAPCCCCLFQPHARALSIKSSTHNTPMHSSSSSSSTTTTTQQYT